MQLCATAMYEEVGIKFYILHEAHMTIRVAPNEFNNAPTCYRSYPNHACIELL